MMSWSIIMLTWCPDSWLPIIMMIGSMSSIIMFYLTKFFFVILVICKVLQYSVIYLPSDHTLGRPRAEIRTRNERQGHRPLHLYYCPYPWLPCFHDCPVSIIAGIHDCPVSIIACIHDCLYLWLPCIHDCLYPWLPVSMIALFPGLPCIHDCLQPMIASGRDVDGKCVSSDRQLVWPYEGVLAEPADLNLDQGQSTHTSQQPVG